MIVINSQKNDNNFDNSDYLVTKPLNINKTKIIYCEEMTKGQKMFIDEFLGDNNLIVGTDWEGNYGEISVMLLNNNKKIEKEENFIFYNNLFSPCGSIRIDSSENDLYKSLIELNLDKVPNDVSHIKFILSIDNDKYLSDVKNISVNIIGKNRSLEYRPDNFSDEHTSIILEIYKYKNQWKIQAVGDGYKKDLENILRDYISDKIQIQ